MQVLFIHSNEEQLRQVEAMLAAVKDEDYGLTGISAYEEVLDVIAHNHYDVCLINSTLGEKTGLELMQTMDAMGCQMPVIAITETINPAEHSAYIEAGATDSVSKSQLNSSVLDHVLRHPRVKLGSANDVLAKYQSLAVSHEKLVKLFTQVETAKKEWERAMDCVSDMVMRIDNEGKIKRCNRALTEFLGKTYRDILQKGWRELLAENGLIIISENLEKNVEVFHGATEKWFVFQTHQYKDPSKHIESDEISGAVIVIHDITELKQTGNELARAYSDLKTAQVAMVQQEKLASLGQLAAGVAHEINNPMAFVLGNVEVLSEYTDVMKSLLTMYGQLASMTRDDQTCGSPGARQKIAEIEESEKNRKLSMILTDVDGILAETQIGLERISSIVKHLKSFASLDEAEEQKVDINECIVTTLEVMSSLINTKAEIIKKLGSLSPIICYPGQLNQVFMNLLQNAVQAIPERGVITVETVVENQEVVIRISDNGEGISPENISKLFNPFFTTKAVGQGTGLGLSEVYGIIEKHKGTINVESQLGAGTTFTIRLPIE